MREALGLDPADALARHFAMRVVALDQLRDSRGAGGWCDGVSLTTDRVICFAPSPHSRRQNFTLLHEFGHFLVNEDNNALDWLADRRHPASDLERLCDAIAAGILLPEAVLLGVLDGQTPAPEHLPQLYSASRASEEVCAIALAGRLPVRGAVVLIRRRTAAVVFAASNGWPPLLIPRGLAVPQHHPLRQLGIRQHWRGWTTADLHLAISEPLPESSMPSLLQARASAGANRVTTILLDTHSGIGDDPHARLDSGMPNNPICICRHCGHISNTIAYPCEDCAVPPCARCGRCRCR